MKGTRPTFLTLPTLYSVYCKTWGLGSSHEWQIFYITNRKERKKKITYMGVSICTGKKKIKKTRHGPSHTLTRQHYNCRSTERGTKIKYLNRSRGRTTQYLALDCFVKKNIWISWCIINLKSHCFMFRWKPWCLKILNKTWLHLDVKIFANVKLIMITDHFNIV